MNREQKQQSKPRDKLPRLLAEKSIHLLGLIDRKTH